eukprot:2865194-Rhodomonas_salina.2
MVLHVAWYHPRQIPFCAYVCTALKTNLRIAPSGPFPPARHHAPSDIHWYFLSQTLVRCFGSSNTASSASTSNRGQDVSTDPHQLLAIVSAFSRRAWAKLSAKASEIVDTPLGCVCAWLYRILSSGPAQQATAFQS